MRARLVSLLLVVIGGKRADDAKRAAATRTVIDEVNTTGMCERVSRARGMSRARCFGSTEMYIAYLLALTAPLRKAIGWICVIARMVTRGTLGLVVGHHDDDRGVFWCGILGKYVYFFYM